MVFREMLFGSQKEQNRTSNKLDVRSDLLEVVEGAICKIMLVNIAMLGMEPQSVPCSGETGSLRSRAYLHGLADTVIQQFEELQPTVDEFMTAFASAFAVTYGTYDWGWALDTIDHFQKNHPDVLSGFRLAQRDVESIYSGQPFSTATGFWLLNSGDEKAIAENLSALG